MKKYKLIKTYPGCDKLGLIISEKENYTKNVYFVEDTNLFVINNPNEYPEFWEKVVEKDYEVISLIHKKYKIVITYEEGGGCYKQELLQSVYHSKDYFVKCFTSATDTWEIHSVKRNDGEIFTVGDITHLTGEIKYFKIDEKSKLLVVGFKDGEDVLEFIKHSKAKLFTTEDSVDIFDGDKFYYVKDFKLSNIRVAKQENTPNPANPKFKYKKNAVEWLVLNTPCLTLQEVISTFSNNAYKRISDSAEVAINNSIKQIVKNKLKL